MPPAALLRHPPVRGAAGLCYGRSDLPLRPGWERRLPAWLRRIRPLGPASVRSSPLSRCRLPAERLAAGLRVPLTLDDRLLEMDFGEWEGRPWDEVPRPALDRWAADPLGFAPPGGETGQALLDRVGSVLDALRRAPGPALVVSHGGPLRLLAPLLRGDPPDLLAPSPPAGVLQIV